MNWIAVDSRSIFNHRIFFVPNSFSVFRSWQMQPEKFLLGPYFHSLEAKAAADSAPAIPLKILGDFSPFPKPFPKSEQAKQKISGSFLVSGITCTRLKVVDEVHQSQQLQTMTLSKFDGLELPASADFHVHLRDGPLMKAVVPTVRRGGVNTVYVSLLIIASHR
jgi:hypothetical protein